MPIVSANPPEIFTLDQWKGLNQQVRRGSLDDHELWWSENYLPLGPGNLRAMWGPSEPIYTAPSGTNILRIFFGYIGLNTPQYGAPPPGRLGFMMLSNGNVDVVDLNTQQIWNLGNIWNPIAPYYWASVKVWRPQWVGHTVGQQGGVVIGSPELTLNPGDPGGLWAWDGTTLYAPGDNAPDWLTNLDPAAGDPQLTMPIGLPGIYTMEVYQQRLYVAGKDVLSYSAPSNGADFATVDGGGSMGYFGNQLVYSYMDLAASSGYLYCFGDSCTDGITNVRLTGSGTPEAPYDTIFDYSNIDPQIGQRFPRPTGHWGRYFTHYAGGGIFLMRGGDAIDISQKVTNLYYTLDPTPFMPTMCPATMFGIRVMLFNGIFTDPWGVKRSMLLVWDGSKWTCASQNLDLTEINCYEDNSVITPYGTDGTSLYQLFAQPDSSLPKRLSTKSLRGDKEAQLAIKNFKRIFVEFHDLDGGGVELTGNITTTQGGVPNGSQQVSFQLTEGQLTSLEPWPISGMGISAHIDLESLSPDFIIERIHLANEQRTLYGA